MIYLSWQDSAPDEIGKSFPHDLIRNGMGLYSDKSIMTGKKSKENKNALALLSNSDILKAFYDWYYQTVDNYGYRF